jgi:hypothetical protein
MRLETIKQEISDLPYISFEEYFHRYAMSVQDKNIDREISFFVDHNFLTDEMLCKIIEQSGRELKLI